MQFVVAFAFALGVFLGSQNVVQRGGDAPRWAVVLHDETDQHYIVRPERYVHPQECERAVAVLDEKDSWNVYVCAEIP
jgi:hypothetical protein